jgi:hypothetical protein
VFVRVRNQSLHAPRVSEGVEKSELSHPVGGDVKWSSYFGK